MWGWRQEALADALKIGINIVKPFGYHRGPLQRMIRPADKKETAHHQVCRFASRGNL